MYSRLQLKGKSQQHCYPLAPKGMLAVAVSLMTVACSNDVNTALPPVASESAVVATTPETPPAEDSSNTSDRTQANGQTAQNPHNTGTQYAEAGDDGEPDEPLTVNIERLHLVPGMPYGEVRSLVIAEGWVPYTQTDVAPPDLNSLTVQALHAQGFEEVAACSGTGQGFCAFLFTHVNDINFPDARLKIMTTPAIGELYGEPNFYDWDMWDYEPVVSSAPKGANPSDAYLEANAIYETQKFNAALYAAVLAQEENCVLIGDCANAQYLFEDVLLTFSQGDFGSTTVAVVPHASVSRSQALDYAQMLDIDGEIDLANSIMVDNYEGGELPLEGVKMTESFFALTPPSEAAASTKMVRLIAKSGEDISRIEFDLVVL
ncbi:MAG: hypothetical protein AAGD09_19540 [Cyanobacteria bacterium P01_F01_bin.56]